MTETPPEEQSGRGDGGEHGVATALAERETPGTAIEPLTVAVSDDVVPDADGTIDAPESSRPWWLLVGAVLAALPLARMTLWVLRGTETQYADYWLMIDEVLLPSGGLRLEQLFEFSNDHPVVIPKIVYWLNLHNTGGSNIALGIVVVGVVAVQIALLAVVLRRSSMPSLAKIAVLVVASALLYTPLGGWNFLKAMSGTAWLTANAFAVAAVVSRWRGRTWVSCAFGVFACLSYGTGLAVWPALLAVGLLRDRWIRALWPTAVVAASVAVAYLASRSAGDERPDVAGPGKLARYFLEVLSGPLVPFDFEQAAWVGGAVFVGTVLVAAAALAFGEWRDVAPWLGLSVYGLVASMLVALGRADLIIGFGSNRHASLGAMAMVGATGMLGTMVAGSGLLGERLRFSRPVAVGSLAVVTLGFAAGSVFADRTEVDRVQDAYARQDRLAIALRFGLAGGTTEPLGALGEMPDDIESLLDANDHLPFGDDDGLDCGLAGQQIDDDAVLSEVPDAIDAKLVERAQELERTAVGTGWIRDDDDLVRCIVVVNADNAVVGAGAIGPEREGYGPSRGVPAGADGFVTVQPIDTDDATYLLVLRDGTFAAVPEAEDAIRF